MAQFSHTASCLLGTLAFCTIVSAQDRTRPVESYAEHPDSTLHEGVPEGRILTDSFSESKVFPGTTREYRVYIPNQYDASQPTALMVFQDGAGYARRDRGFRVPNVFDNLIARGEMPVTIGLFINPGIVPAKSEQVQTRFNRSFEYDSVDDRYARFLIDEIIPHVQRLHDLNLSQNPDDWAIAGASSGAIAAFNVAWHRPDRFRRVFSTIGTYVGLRGGETYSTMVRKTEPKPIRVFLQDGSNDLNLYGGDWWMANQAMLRSLEWAGYEVDHVFGQGYHSGAHGAAIFPDVMKWLWKDHGKVPVKTHWERSNSDATRFLVENEGWQRVSTGHQWAEGLAVDDDGTLYFTDVRASKLYRLTENGDTELLADDTGKANGLAIGPDGKLYGACGGSNEIRSWDLGTMEMEVVSSGAHANDIVVRRDGTIFFTDPREGKVWMLDRETGARTEAASLQNCNGITLSSDQSQLLVADFRGRFIYSYMVDDDGTLRDGQPFHFMEIPANERSGMLDGMCSTHQGWLVASSKLGVQVCDQLGRSHLIMPMPHGTQRSCYVAFGGPERKTLYVATGDSIWKRPTQLTGAQPWREPVKPPRPRL